MLTTLVIGNSPCGTTTPCLEAQIHTALLGSPIVPAADRFTPPCPPWSLADGGPKEDGRSCHSPPPASSSPAPEYPVFVADNTSILRCVLTRELFARLCRRRTPSGFTIADVIRSGVEHQDSKVGIYAGDVESYATFKELFDPVIRRYQEPFGSPERHLCDFDARKLAGNPDPSGRYVLSVRARVARNVTGFPFSPNITPAQRAQVEAVVIAALSQTTLPGRYWALPKMSAAEKQMLIDQHLLFNGVDRFQRSAGILRDWPQARGMFQTETSQLLVWVNEQDHLRIISLQPGTDMAAVFHRLAEGIHIIGSALEAMGYPFVYDKVRGYMGSEPSQLGTGLRASVLIRLPLLSAHPDFRALCGARGLGVRGTNGEHTPIVDGVVDISNRRRLGRTEVDLVQLVVDGSQQLIALEQRLERGETL
jgi:protein-arginine kinase